MAQQCRACNSRDSAALDAALIEGVLSIGQLSEKHHLGQSGLRRHRQNHVSASVIRGPRVGSQVTPGFLLEELVSILTDSQRVRESAALAGRGDLVLKAGREGRATVELLLTKLGIDDGALAEQFSQQEALARAVFSIIRQIPQIGGVIADKLTEAGHDEVADDIRQVAATAELALERTAA